MARKRKKVYGMAPLPFQGQKRMWKKEFKEVIEELPDDTVVVDLFGGSGLLSHFAKEANNNLRVIYNDYDDYSNRLAHIDETNEILAKIRAVCKHLPRPDRLPKDAEEQIRDILKEAYENYRYVDFYTIGRSIVFSSRAVSSFEEVLRSGYYNRVVRNPYTVHGYLDGVEVVRDDYIVVLNKYKDLPNVIFLIDPPYLSTDNASYGSVDSYGLSWNIQLLDNIRHHKYILFTSEKSEILDLMKSVHNGTMLDGVEIRTRTYGVGTKSLKGTTDRDMIMVDDIMILNIKDKPKVTDAKKGGFFAFVRGLFSR